MNSLKLGWIFPVFVLLDLITVIGVGVYQVNSEKNPWHYDKKPIYNRDFSGGAVMEPKIVKKPAINIVGFANKTKSNEGEYFKAIPKFWNDYYTDGRQEKIHKELFLKNHKEYGVSFPENPENGEFDYVIGLEIKKGRDIPKGYHVYTIPEALYAVFSTPPADEAKFISSVQDTWKYILNEWFPKSGYDFTANGVNFELYDERCMRDTDKIVDICIPVVKK